MDHETKHGLCSGKPNEQEVATSQIDDEFSEKVKYYFRVAVFRKGHFSINNDIQGLVHHLEKEHWICREEILRKILFIAEGRNLQEKYDPEKSSLGTYLTGCVLNFLRELRKSLEQGDPPDRRLGAWIDDIKEFNIVPKGHTPEDLYITKELYELTLGYFDDVETRVLFKEITRKEAYKETSKGYDKFRKEFRIKVDEFREFLLSVGYDDPPFANMAA